MGRLQSQWTTGQVSLHLFFFTQLAITVDVSCRVQLIGQSTPSILAQFEAFLTYTYRQSYIIARITNMRPSWSVAHTIGMKYYLGVVGWVVLFDKTNFLVLGFNLDNCPKVSA